MSLCVRKPTICMGENKDADQLRGNREADQRLCFRYTDSIFPPLLIPKFSRSWVSSVTVQGGLCRTCSETTLLVFSCTGSNCFFLTSHYSISAPISEVTNLQTYGMEKSSTSDHMTHVRLHIKTQLALFVNSHCHVWTLPPFYGICTQK